MLPPKAWRFILLNGIRALSIVALLLVLISNILIIVKDVKAVQQSDKTVESSTNNETHIEICDYFEGSTVPNQPLGVFWAVLNRILILAQVILLLFSEVGWPQPLFERVVPFLGQEHGVGASGTLQCLLGAQILSHFVDTFPMVAAFFLFSIGCLNLLMALIFGKSVKEHRSILWWKRGGQNMLPRTKEDLAKMAGVPSPLVSAVSSFSSKNSPSRQPSIESHGFGRQGEKAAGKKGFLVAKPIDALPTYSQYSSSNMGSPSRYPGRY